MHKQTMLSALRERKGYRETGGEILSTMESSVVRQKLDQLTKSKVGMVMYLFDMS